MGLFQKKTPQYSSNAPLYTLGLQKTILIVGLGNPGKEYEDTRHNIGFETVDGFAKQYEFPDWTHKKDLKCLLTATVIGDSRIVLIKPVTFMNESGQAAQATMHFYKVPLSQVLVVHDELDIEFGQIRTRIGGSAAGHNGIKSLIQHLGEDFGRIRIGVHNDIAKKADSASFVLSKFSKEEQAHIPAMIKETNAMLSEYVHGQPLSHETRSFIV